jgi:hypothetical protein
MQVKMRALLSQLLLVSITFGMFIVPYSFATEYCILACEVHVLTNDCIPCTNVQNECTTDCFVTYDTGPQKARQCRIISKPNLHDQYWQKRKYDCTYPRDGIDDCICIYKWYAPKPTKDIGD